MDASALIVVWLWLYCFCFCYNVGPSTRVNKKGSVSDLDTMWCQRIQLHIWIYSSPFYGWNMKSVTRFTLYIVPSISFYYHVQSEMFHNSQVPSVPVLLGSCQADCRYHNSQLNIPSRPQSPLTSFPLSSGSGSDEGSEESSEMRGVEWLTRHQAEGISSHSHILNLSAQPHSGSSNIALSQCHRPSSLIKLSMHCLAMVPWYLGSAP